MVTSYINNWKEYFKTWGDARAARSSPALKVVIYTMLCIAFFFVLFGLGKDD